MPCADSSAPFIRHEEPGRAYLQGRWGNRSGEQAPQPADDEDRGLVSSLTIARAGSTRRTSPADTPAYIAIASIVPVACRPGAGAANRGSGNMPSPAGLAPA